MGTNWLGIAGFLLFDGIVIAWGLRELWTLRRDRQPDAEPPKRDPNDPV